MVSMYLFQQSWLHRWSAGFKLILLAGCSLLLLPVNSIEIMLLSQVFVGLLYCSLGNRGWRHLSLVIPLLPFLFAIIALHWWVGTLYEGSVAILRLILMFLLASLVTLTTRMSDMMAALEPCFRPLQYIGISPRSLALAVALMIRFAPVLVGVINSLDEAWRSRGGGRAKWKLMVPLLVQAIKISDQVGDALTARGGSEGIKYKAKKQENRNE